VLLGRAVGAQHVDCASSRHLGGRMLPLFNREVSAGNVLLCRFQSRGHSLTDVLRVHVRTVTHESSKSWYATCEFAHVLTHNDCSVLL